MGPRSEMSYYIFFIVHFLSTCSKAPSTIMADLGIGIRKCRLQSRILPSLEGEDLDMQGEGTNLKICVYIAEHTASYRRKYAFASSKFLLLKSHHHQAEGRL